MATDSGSVTTSLSIVQFSDHAKSLNLPEPKWPSFAIQQIQESLKFPMPQSQTVDAKNVGEFVGKFVKGEIAASIKSQPVPTSQDEPVYNVVADTFEDVILKETKKDIFLELYASWCGHCKCSIVIKVAMTMCGAYLTCLDHTGKRLAPIWETLGEKFVNSKDDIMIAKMDANENDIPPAAGFRVQGFPTIKFKPAGSSEFIDYDGDRSLESFLEYIETNSVNKVKPDATAKSTPIAAGETGKHDELCESTISSSSVCYILW